MSVYVSVPTEKSEAKNFRDLEQKVKLAEFGNTRDHCDRQFIFMGGEFANYKSENFIRTK